MMVKNDPGQRWVNGTIAKIAALGGDGVFVEIDGRRHILDKEKWDNHSYRYDSYEGRVVQDIVGSFVQFPVRLAWAATIYKSQGQTRGAFSHGQTYVALSRCIALEGIVLKRPLRRADIIIDPLISDTEKAFHINAL